LTLEQIKDKITGECETLGGGVIYDFTEDHHIANLEEARECINSLILLAQQFIDEMEKLREML
jgi:hypothetical protein